MITTSTILYAFKFDYSNKSERKQLDELSKKLNADGMKCFYTGIAAKREWFEKTILPLNGHRITLECDHVFSDQWNTAPTKTSEQGLRIFDWDQGQPGDGYTYMYYLEQTPDMRAIRRDTCRCGWCGKNYHKPEQEFCNACLGSEHLKEEDLFLLHLTPISEGLKDPKFTVPQSLITEYRERQRLGHAFMSNKRLEDKKAELKKDLEKANTEYRAMMALIEGGIDFDNVIYYPHTNEVSFGWRTPLSKAEEFKIKNAIAEIMVKPGGVELSESVPFTEEYNVKFKTQ